MTIAIEQHDEIQVQIGKGGVDEIGLKVVLGGMLDEIIRIVPLGIILGDRAQAREFGCDRLFHMLDVLPHIAFFELVDIAEQQNRRRRVQDDVERD